MTTATYVDCDDWEGLYVGDELVTQGHAITHREWLTTMVEYDVTDYEEISDVRLWADHNRSSLPSTLTELEGLLA